MRSKVGAGDTAEKGVSAIMRLIMLAFFLVVPECVPASQTGFEDRDPYASHFAFELPPQQTWRAILGWLYRDVVKPAAGSDTPRGYWSQLIDGEPGKAGDDGSFLVFDGKHVALDINLPAWRVLDTLALTAREPRFQAGNIRLMIDGEGRPRRIVFSRQWLDGVATYRANRLAVRGSRLRLEYQAGGAVAELGELYLDNLGNARTTRVRVPQVRTIAGWQSAYGLRECERVTAGYELARSGGQHRLLTHLAGTGSTFGTRWIGLTSVREGQKTTHALMFQVDDTGDPRMDLVRAWLVIPEQGARPRPLVVLPHQGHVYAALEPLGIGGERELALGPELLAQGVAVLGLDSFRFGDKYGLFSPFYQSYPGWSYTGKDLDNLRRVMDVVLTPAFQTSIGIAVDEGKLGIWGYSYGSWIAMLAGLVDHRFKAVAFSSFHYRDADIAHGLSHALYIPQLACVDNKLEPPLSVPAILREHAGRSVLAVASDQGLWNAWNQNLPPNIKVVINPNGHMVSEAERAGIANFMLTAFGMTQRVAGPVGSSPWVTDATLLAPHIESENLWRTRLLDALAKPR